jgi:uncharacterized protein
MRCSNVIAFILVIVGAINMGIYGVSHFDFIAWLFSWNWCVRVVDVLIGLSGIWCIGFFCQCKKKSSCYSKNCSCLKGGSCEHGKESSCCNKTSSHKRDDEHK